MIRFRKRINVMPGLKLNLSKTGASFSVGGLWGFLRTTLNIGRRPRITNSIPGTGLSDVEYLNRE